MDVKGRVSVQLIILADGIRRASTSKVAMRGFNVKRGGDLLIAPAGFTWGSRDSLKPFRLKDEVMFFREDILIDPVGRLTDRGLARKPLVEALRSEGYYGFLIDDFMALELMSPDLAGRVLLVNSRSVKVG